MAQPDDGVMLVKESWSSERIAHPLGFAWNSAVSIQLQMAPSAVCCKNTLITDQIWQCRRTTAAVLGAPWHLVAASGYLTNWCAQIEVGALRIWAPGFGCLAPSAQRQRWTMAALAISTGVAESVA